MKQFWKVTAPVLSPLIFFNTVMGFIGALLGTFLAGKLGLPELIALPIAGWHFPIVWSIIGAALFVAVINLISRPRV